MSRPDEQIARLKRAAHWIEPQQAEEDVRALLDYVAYLEEEIGLNAGEPDEEQLRGEAMMDLA